MRDTRKKVNAQAEVLQSRLSYNEIGQMKTKELHQNATSGKFLNTIAYKYNTRGWLKESRGENFIQVLRYDSLDAGYTKQYHGNISQQYWRYTPTESARMTVYSYDTLNRLKLATSSGVTLSEELTYDDRGNIRTLKRDGGTTTTYTYDNSDRRNRLLSLTGGISGGYTYDENGNAKTDRTGMNFTYNYPNLPQSVTKPAAGSNPAVTVSYLYDAMGSKLRKTATVGSTSTVRDYIGGIEYSKTGSAASTIERIATEEGYLQNNSDTYVHHYNLTDHLGNVCSVIRAEGSGVAVVQKQDYYAFGKTKSILTGGINRYLYNGKEVQAEIGDQLDFGARFYDAEIGRWNVVDPMAEAAYDWSPYRYGYNNPIKFIDPTGMLEDDYSLDEQGNIELIRKTDDKFDRLIVLDESGSETEAKIEVEKNVLNKVEEDKNLDGKTYNFLNIKNNQTATKLFEFVSDNTKVEWSLIKTEIKGSFVSTSHDYTSESGNPHLMAKLNRDRIGVLENIHSHPGQYSEGPSGFRIQERSLPNSDRKSAEAMKPYFPNTIFKVYRVFNKTYTRYDGNKIY